MAVAGLLQDAQSGEGVHAVQTMAGLLTDPAWFLCPVQSGCEPCDVIRASCTAANVISHLGRVETPLHSGCLGARDFELT